MFLSGQRDGVRTIMESNNKSFLKTMKYPTRVFARMRHGPWAPPTITQRPVRANDAYQQSNSGGEETFADVLNNIFNSLANSAEQGPRGAHVCMDTVSYHPASSDVPLLQDVSMEIEPNTLSLVYGCSGGGKSTLLHILAGLSQETSGRVLFQGPHGPTIDSTSRMHETGLVFQFPERHFIGETLQDELTIAWPVHGPSALALQQVLTARTYKVLDAVGLRHIPLDTPLDHLSGGYKRRVALAVQLIRQPRLLLLDEPLAGLDWKARHDLVSVLDTLCQECTVLVVSHDLGEVQSLVNSQYRMHKGGILTPS